MKINDFSLKEILKIIGHYFIWTAWGYWLLFYSLVKVSEGKSLEYFRLGNLPIPVFYETTYIEIAIFTGALVIAVAYGFYLRYVTYGDELHFKKMYNIKDNKKFSDDLMDIGRDDFD